MQAEQRDDVAVWCKKFQAMISDGKPILDALAQLREEARTSRLKEATAELRRILRKGGLLSDGMASYADLFPEPTPGMMRMGENYGIADIMLGVMSEYVARFGTPADVAEPGAPATRIAGEILAKAGRVNAREIRLAADGNGSRVAFDGEDLAGPPAALFAQVVKALLRLAGIGDWQSSASPDTGRAKASLEWDGTPVSCVLQSSDIAKELTVRREEG